MGHTSLKDHTRVRATLPLEVSVHLADAHRRSGLSFRAAAQQIGIDFGYWRRLTLGERCPSIPVARRIISVLALDDNTAGALLEAAVPKRG